MNATEWLARWNEGDAAALDHLMPVIYNELHRLASGYLRAERCGHTLQPTALIHEAYVQVRKLPEVDWTDRAQFIGLAAQAMRRILVRHARARRAEKRGGEFAVRVEGDPDRIGNGRDADLMALDDALDRLAEVHPRQDKVVELRFSGGQTVEQIVDVSQAQGTSISLRTAERDWRFARAWLQQAMAVS